MLKKRVMLSCTNIVLAGVCIGEYVQSAKGSAHKEDNQDWRTFTLFEVPALWRPGISISVCLVRVSVICLKINSSLLSYFLKPHSIKSSAAYRDLELPPSQWWIEKEYDSLAELSSPRAALCSGYSLWDMDLASVQSSHSNSSNVEPLPGGKARRLACPTLELPSKRYQWKRTTGAQISPPVILSKII